jgi:nickel/cobalt transporter (NicO) family protein
MIDGFAKNPLTRRWASHNLSKSQGQISRILAFCDAIMIRGMCTLLILLVLLSASTIQAQNPFQSSKPRESEEQTAAKRPSLLVKIAIWQGELRHRMAELVRRAGTEGVLGPLAALLALAFGYGVLHAAGPGHGKVVAMTLILSRKAPVRAGVLFGFGIAFVHGLSGTLSVLALYGILEVGVSGSLAKVTTVTQAASFGLISIIGLGILLANVRALLSSEPPRGEPTPDHAAASDRPLIPWAVAVGIVPCPGVTMVLLFCLSMDALLLGLFLAACISLGMAVTISAFVVGASRGKGLMLAFLSKGGLPRLEHLLGALSGIAVAALGGVFLAASLV